DHGARNLNNFKDWHSTLYAQRLKKGKYKKRIEKDIRDGVEMGIQGTPTFVLGSYDHESGTVSGEMFSGAVSEEKFFKAIEKYLALTGTEAKLSP
ncbi:MAG: hypothetical protein HN597_20985, partial [Desulfobacula sp.]|uniref:DsbA family protein n=1 Tax=Desulfobacula sp. TaxID=2593537 RepID=UPI0039B990C4|nr:hypothetical protein [Desulfobacula sp.]